MLDGSPDHSDEANAENNQPMTSGPGGVNYGLNTGGKARQALLKKGGRKLRSTAPLHHHQKPPRSGPSSRLTDLNNNSTSSTSSTLAALSAHKPAAQPGTEPPAGTGTGTAQTLHHLKQGAKKELLKSKGVRLERGAVQTGNQAARGLPRHDQVPQNGIPRTHKPRPGQNPGAAHSTKKKDTSSPSKPLSLHQSPLRGPKKPLHASDNVKSAEAEEAGEAECLKDGEKVYAGAKFSEPPSPSVLPKPPSHWVGEDGSQRGDRSRQQMTVHLKSLLKVQNPS